MNLDKFVFIAIISTSSACAPAPSGWASIDGVGILGVSADGEAYVCGQDTSVDRSRWLAGDDVLTDDDDEWTLTPSSDGAFSLRAADGEEWEGVLTEFEDGGLYEAAPEACRSGAVLHGGTLAGTWCDGVGIFRQVEPVDAITGGPQTILVSVRDLADYTFTLQRLP